MKTLLELNALIPAITSLMKREDPEIGNFEEREYESNTFTYEEDGWLIEIDYRCTGFWDIEPETWDYPGCCEVKSAWGEVDEIRATHFDEETEEETEFSEEDLTDLFMAVNRNLENIV